MDFIKTGFYGLYIVKNIISTDDRGKFIKRYNKEEFERNGIFFNLEEQYFSVSKKDVIRGMHFQAPPYDHSKLVYVINGSIVDVVVDLRKNSPTYGKCFEQVLTSKENTSLFISSGFAHGFKALEDDTLMMYNVSSKYNKDSDMGIKWNSIDYDWGIKNPIISKRDSEFLSFQDFNSPF